MQPLRSASILIIGLTTAALLTPTPVRADTPGQAGVTFTRSPDHGAPGSVIEVSGTGCKLDGRAMEYAAVDADRDTEPYANFGEDYPISPDGSWSGQLFVPADVPPGAYVMSMACVASDMLLDGGTHSFTVDGVAATTTIVPTTAPPTTTKPPNTDHPTSPPPTEFANTTSTTAAVVTTSLARSTTAPKGAAQLAAHAATSGPHRWIWAALASLLVALLSGCAVVVRRRGC